MSRFSKGFAAIAAVALISAVAVGSGSASPVAQKSAFTACNIDGKQKRLGASYVTSLKVQGVSCAKAEKVIKAYHRCRKDNGGAGGSCGSTVLGFTCKDGKRVGVPDVQYNATAKCRKNANANKRVKSSYTQNY
jgi:hypothetical protein